jgi:hypothetical protein
MPHARKAGFAAVLTAATFLLGGYVLPDQEARAGASLFRDVVTLVTTRYVDTLDVSDVYERAAEGLVDRLEDPYADLFSPEEMEEFTVAYEGHYAGVGMLIETQEGATIVRRVFPNTPAERTGVQMGDRIVQVDGRAVRRLAAGEGVERAQGRAGDGGGGRVRPLRCEPAHRDADDPRRGADPRRAVRHGGGRRHRLHPAPPVQRDSGRRGRGGRRRAGPRGRGGARPRPAGQRRRHRGPGGDIAGTLPPGRHGDRPTVGAWADDTEYREPGRRRWRRTSRWSC